MRDRMQREELYRAQMKEREGLQGQIARIQQRHREERRHFRERIAMVLGAQKRHRAPSRQRGMSYEMEH